MKTAILRLLALTALAFIVTAAAHAHEKITAGPNKGRLLTVVKPHAEFFVTAERKVQITFVGEDGKPVAPAAQVVTVTAGERTAPQRLTFTQTGNVLLSDAALPAGNDYPTVVQIKTTPDAKPVYEVAPESWTGGIINPKRSPTCLKRDVRSVRSSKQRWGLRP